MYDPDTLAELEALELACVLSGAKTEDWRQHRIACRDRLKKQYYYHYDFVVSGLNINHEIEALQLLLVEKGD